MATDTQLPCPNCEWWVESRVIGMPRAKAMLAEHQAAHPPKATFPPERELYVLPPVVGDLCGVMVSNDPRARCSKETDHDGPHDIVPDRHARTPASAVVSAEGALVLTWSFESGATMSVRAPWGARITAAELAAFVSALRGLVAS